MVLNFRTRLAFDFVDVALLRDQGQRYIRLERLLRYGRSAARAFRSILDSPTRKADAISAVITNPSKLDRHRDDDLRAMEEYSKFEFFERKRRVLLSS